jgi:alanyl-tRNA synthetase
VQADELRQRFLDFFSQRAHTVVPSAGLIPHHPSAPMFTNSGMMQFVPYFLGEESPPFSPPRAVTVQKCVRAGGKHNDLDAIGRSPRHLSFFEMLGNFSFGDYFKEDAIAWAWQFVTEELGLDGDNMWITVHVSDDEAAQIWVDRVGIAPERVQRLDADNFWEMGDTGPCGPSSELFWDYGPELGPGGGPANPEAEHRYVEIWNLVFPQFIRGVDGSLSPMARPGIDTGAGLERILAVLAGSPSLYDADVLATMVEAAQRATGHRLGESELTDIALRLLADHSRTMTFLVADGVVPSNEDRGYVLRRIIRRAVRFAYLIGVEALVLPALVEHCISVMGGAYPELRARSDLVIGTITREEERFRSTLATGSQLLDTHLEGLQAGDQLDGAVAFQLHDTYGFPLEVTQEFAELRGVTVDVAGFEREMAAQRERARAASRSGRPVVGSEASRRLGELLQSHGPTEFTGREESTSTGTILAVDGDVVITDRTPFYAESGGQVGDTGTITTPTGRAVVTDTTYLLPGLVGHSIGSVEGTLEVGQEATLSIDVDRRNAIRRNHTGTHILHWALREVLGDHVTQQGSLVAPDRLRFDFSHFEALTDDQIRQIEDLANREILGNAPVRHYETSREHATEIGAIAFFGEKYGDIVRVLEAGEHSVELCGGTHVRALGDIGPLKIISEGSIGANIRRIEAVTGTGTVERLRAREDLLAAASSSLGVPTDDLVEGIDKRLAELRALREEVTTLRRRLAAAEAGSLVSRAVDGVLVARVEAADRGEVRDLALSLRDQPGIRAVVLGASPGGKGVALVAAVRPDSGFHAGELIAEAVEVVGGGGGKGDEIAAAGGRHPERLDEALDRVRAAAGIL